VSRFVSVEELFAGRGVVGKRIAESQKRIVTEVLDAIDDIAPELSAEPPSPSWE
jgi:hypothetical protein